MRKVWIPVSNVITGLFVAFFSIVSYLFSGMGEGSSNNAGLLIWFLVWGVGFILQVKLKNKTIGLVITFIPVAFFIFVYIVATIM